MIDNDPFTFVFENLFTPEWCQNVIDKFEEASKAGFVESRQASENAPSTYKRDGQVFSSAEGYLAMFGEENAEFCQTFWDVCYKAYDEKFSLSSNHEGHGIFFNKIQKTEPAGGYHVWHCENSSRDCSRRILTYILYLNDVEEGGETELLYQSNRIKAQTGRLVLFPAAFTHTHRGNPPLSGSKYIITGWVEM